jgi:hypothetical protein
MIRILFLAANPEDTSRLKLDYEFNIIDDMLQMTPYKHQFDLVSRHGISTKKLQQLFLRFEPQIVHFSGHGSDNGALIFQNEFGHPEEATPAALESLFRIIDKTIRCVVLNACYSVIQAEGIVKYVDCVIGMSHSIRDDAASLFASSFYQALGYGKSVRQAFELGLNQIQLSNIEESDLQIKTINLRSKQGTDASKIILTDVNQVKSQL